MRNFAFAFILPERLTLRHCKKGRFNSIGGGVLRYPVPKWHLFLN